MTTSNNFAAAHRLRIAVSSSNFPRFDRNMNTGGNSYDEGKKRGGAQLGRHLHQYPSQITLTVVQRQPTS